MKLIVGLGNPGQEYARTRHNLGFMVLDHLAQQYKVSWVMQKKLKSEIFVGLIEGQTIALAKPQTFMNDSGTAVQKIKQFYKLDNNDIWIVSDDIDLDYGTVRTRVGGSSGGQNGLKNIIDHIGEDFVRIRVGIKNEILPKQPAEKFVLERFRKDEELKLPEIINHTSELIINNINDLLTPDTSRAI